MQAHKPRREQTRAGQEKKRLCPYKKLFWLLHFCAVLSTYLYVCALQSFL